MRAGPLYQNRARLEEKNKNLILSIQDYASGIPKKVQEKLFKEMITTKGKNGTGLGLSIVKNILGLHNYNYGIHSIKGKGTTFYFEIPKRKEQKNFTITSHNLHN